VDVFDREAVFVERHGRALVERFPALRIVFEHLTTRDGVDFVRAARAGVGRHADAAAPAAQPQRAVRRRLRPHAYCLPVLKRETHREALVAAATSGDPRFFLGTDSAPHPRHAKESDCGCAGIYSAHAAIELYAEVFDAAGALDRLEAFASFHGADFHGLARNTGSVTLVRRPVPVPATLDFGDGQLVPMRAGGQVGWAWPSFAIARCRFLPFAHAVAGRFIPAWLSSTATPSRTAAMPTVHIRFTAPRPTSAP
jgi:dihydroorotase